MRLFLRGPVGLPPAFVLFKNGKQTFLLFVAINTTGGGV